MREGGRTSVHHCTRDTWSLEAGEAALLALTSSPSARSCSKCQKAWTQPLWSMGRPIASERYPKAFPRHSEGGRDCTWPPWPSEDASGLLRNWKPLSKSFWGGMLVVLRQPSPTSGKALSLQHPVLGESVVWGWGLRGRGASAPSLRLRVGVMKLVGNETCPWLHRID